MGRAFDFVYGFGGFLFGLGLIPTILLAPFGVVMVIEGATGMIGAVLGWDFPLDEETDETAETAEAA